MKIIQIVHPIGGIFFYVSKMFHEMKKEKEKDLAKLEKLKEYRP